MVRQTRQLIHWWLHELRFAAAAAVHSWRHSPEWPLLAVSKLLLASSALHWLGYRLARFGLIFAPTEWEGRTGWRKPMLFGVSNAMVFGALAKGLAAQSVMPRATSAHAAAWSTAVEVAVITVQSWRGQPSHFNTSTRVDAALYAAKLTGVTILGVVCLATAAGCVLRCHHTSAPDRAALRCGLLLLSCAVLVGFGQVAYGHSLLPRADSEITEQECRRVTVDVAGAPCYEVYGGALLKILHFVPLHSTEPLLLLSWASVRAGRSERQSLRSVHHAAAGLALLTLASTWQVARAGKLSLPGLARLDLEPPAALMVVAGTLAVLLAFGEVALAPLGPGMALATTSRKKG